MPWLGPAPEDFRVEELPLYPPSGRGDHCFVRVEKRAVDTEAVATALAQAAGVRRRDVGYAGRKDRQAVARQWFSLPGLAPERARELVGEGFRVLEAARHEHRLRTGQLRGNRFELRLGEVDATALAAAGERLALAVRRGLANRYGAQRYGRHGDNAERGRALLAGAAGPRDRRAARFLLSALQAELFDAVLARRPLPADALEAGDVAVVHASGGLFVVEEPEAELERLAEFAISPTGPIFGTRMKGAQGAPGARESALRVELGIPQDHELRPPRGVRLRGGRRALRVQPGDAQVERCGAAAARLVFWLPAGSYATVLVETLFGPGAARRAPADAAMTGEGASRTLGSDSFSGGSPA